MRALVEREVGGVNRQDAFGENTPSGQLFRSLGATFAAVSFANATRQAITDPNVESIIAAAQEGAGLAQDLTQLASGVGLAGTDSVLGKFGASSGIGKLIGIVGVGLSVVDTARKLEDGDNLQGALSGVSALGAAVSLLGAGSWAGPAGLIVSSVAALGSLGIDQFRSTREANRHETDDARAFLQALGYNEEAAKQLSNNTGDELKGASPMPVLQHYMQEMGLGPSETVDFINHYADTWGGGELKKLVENLHGVLEDVDGDMSRIRESRNYAEVGDMIAIKVQQWPRPE